MENTPLISVIIPVYNTGVKIHKTIKSIINQTLSDFELLLVNDGSTDKKTIEICEFYQAKDKRIKLISKANEGIEKTRRKGIQLAVADYIVHMDHDDWYTKDALEILYNTAKKNDVEIVIANNCRVYNFLGLFNFKVKHNYDLPKLKVISQNEYIQDYYINFFGVNLYPVSLWAKIYKKSLFDNFEPFCLGYNLIEDIVFNIQTFPLASKIAITDVCIYNYRYGGLTSIRNLDYVLEGYSEMYNVKQKHIEKYNYVKAVPYINYELKNVFVSFINQMIESGNNDKQNVIGILKDYSRNTVYLDMQKFYSEINSNDLFCKAIVENDFEAMYEIQYKYFEKLKYKNKIKRILTKYILK